MTLCLRALSAGSIMRLFMVSVLTCALTGLFTDATADESGVELLFATTRASGNSSEPADLLGNEAGALRYGWCRVAHDGTPRESRWSGYRDFLLPGTDRHMEDAALLAEEDFWARLRAHDQGPVVLFVHGYAYGFERGCLRVSDLQMVLGNTAQVILFSWPSAGNVFAYDADRESMVASVQALADTIGHLNGAVGPQRLRLVSHSMGTQGLLRAIDTLRGRQLTAPIAGNLILIAPDYETERFQEEVPALAGSVDRITLYSSGKDRLLILSSLVNGTQRLGQGGDEVFVNNDIETVDLSGLPRYHPGTHEYHYFNPSVVADLRELLMMDLPAAERRLTAPATRGGVDYWKLREAEPDIQRGSPASEAD